MLVRLAPNGLQIGHSPASATWDARAGTLRWPTGTTSCALKLGKTIRQAQRHDARLQPSPAAAGVSLVVQRHTRLATSARKLAGVTRLPSAPARRAASARVLLAVSGRGAASPAAGRHAARARIPRGLGGGLWLVRVARIGHARQRRFAATLPLVTLRRASRRSTRLGAVDSAHAPGRARRRNGVRSRTSSTATGRVRSTPRRTYPAPAPGTDSGRRCRRAASDRGDRRRQAQPDRSRPAIERRRDHRPCPAGIAHGTPTRRARPLDRARRPVTPGRGRRRTPSRPSRGGRRALGVGAVCRSRWIPLGVARVAAGRIFSAVSGPAVPLPPLVVGLGGIRMPVVSCTTSRSAESGACARWVRCV